MSRTVTKKLADGYMNIFFKIAIKEGIYDIELLSEFILNMNADEFCSYKLSDHERDPTPELTPELTSDLNLEVSDD